MPTCRSAVAAAIAAVLAAAPVASAVDYAIPAGDAAQFQQRLVDAATSPDADRILLAPGTYAAGSSGFAYVGASPLEIIGAGQGVTTLTSTSVVGTVDLSETAATRLAHVTVVVPSGGGARRGVVAAGDTIEDVSITGSVALSPGSEGLLLAGGGTARRVTVDGMAAAGLRIVDGTPGSVTVEDSVFDVPSAFQGVLNSSARALTARRLRVRASVGVRMELGATVNLSDTLIEATSTGIDLSDGGQPGPFSQTFTGDRLTVVGAATGMSVSAQGAGNTVTGTLRGSVVHGAADPFVCTAGSGTAVLETHFTNAPATGGSDNCDTPILFDNFTSTAPGFVDLAARDYRLRFDSPLVDTGDPAAPIGTDVLDLSGLTRVVDGDGNGVARHDRGAFEYPRRAPVVSAQASVASALVGTPITFSASATDPDPFEAPVTYSWAFDDGAVATGSGVSHAFSTPGAHTATATVTDTAGATAAVTLTVTVSAPAAPPADTKPPAISGLRVASRIVRGTVLPRSGRAYTAIIRYRLSEDARVGVRFERRVNGVWRLVPGAFVVRGQAGLNGLRFRGRLSPSVRLAPGDYRIRLRATDTAGNRSAYVRARFTLAR